jgi:predicted DNA-binding protein YlxM (UPF0122 family)
MALAEKRAEAESLYVRKSLSCPSIAETLGVDAGTVYRWKAEASEQGEGSDWDTQRRIYNLSPRELVAIYSETVKSWLIKLKANPDLLSDGKIADALSKHISALRKIDTRGQYMGAITDLIRVTNAWLAEHEPELKARLEPYWDSIFEELKAYSTNKGLF